jgi:hypothetical protein
MAERTPLEKQVETLISEFDTWFQTVPEPKNEPLVRSEVAILKTFAWYLVYVRNTTSLPGVVLPVQEKPNATADVPDEVQPVQASGDAASQAGGSAVT